MLKEGVKEVGSSVAEIGKTTGTRQDKLGPEREEERKDAIQQTWICAFLLFYIFCRYDIYSIRPAPIAIPTTQVNAIAK